MKDTVKFRPEWLDALSACSAKVQMDIISAIVRWQSEGVMPEFKGMKMALFLFLKADLEGAQADSQTETTADNGATGSKTETSRPADAATPPRKEHPMTYCALDIHATPPNMPKAYARC